MGFVAYFLTSLKIIQRPENPKWRIMIIQNKFTPLNPLNWNVLMPSRDCFILELIPNSSWLNRIKENRIKEDKLNKGFIDWPAVTFTREHLVSNLYRDRSTQLSLSKYHLPPPLSLPKEERLSLCPSWLGYPSVNWLPLSSSYEQ